MMKKRASERIPAYLDCRCFDIEYFGTITNLSENGIFLRSQKISFPLDTEFELSFHLKEEKINVPVKVRRITKSNGYYDGIGVEILNCPGNYLKLINRLRSLCKSIKHSPMKRLGHG
jgi:hypothetical protein